MNIRFRYFGKLDVAKGTGKIVVAYDQFGRCGISFCNPNEYYSKSLGKGIAAYRLYADPITLPKQDMSYSDYINLFFNQDKVVTPKWLYKDQTI